MKINNRFKYNIPESLVERYMYTIPYSLESNPFELPLKNKGMH